MNRVFGWDLPPGAAGDPRAPWNQEEGPCDVCGKSIDDCICPVCPQCGAVGDPDCYEMHGLVLTNEQIESKAKIDKKNEEAQAALIE